MHVIKDISTGLEQSYMSLRRAFASLFDGQNDKASTKGFLLLQVEGVCRHGIIG